MGEEGHEVPQTLHVLLQIRWKLKEDGSPAPAELLRDVQEVAELVLGLLEPLIWCVILREALSMNEKTSGTFPDQSVKTFRDGMR